MLTQRELALATIDAITLACLTKHGEHASWKSRFEQAAALVKQNSVRYLPDPANYLVKSSDGTREYAVDVTAQLCECADHPPEGLRCKHRYAVDIYKKALVRVAAVKEQERVHEHQFVCGHQAPMQCWDPRCLEPANTQCSACAAASLPLEHTPALAAAQTEGDSPGEAPEEAPADPHGYQARLEAQLYEYATTREPSGPVPTPTVSMPEAPASLNLKLRLPGGHELMYTMRSLQVGAAGDAELLERLPGLLAQLQAQVEMAFPKPAGKQYDDGK